MAATVAYNSSSSHRLDENISRIIFGQILAI